MNISWVLILILFMVSISGCGTTSNDLKMKIIEAQMAQNAQVYQLNSMPKYEIKNCTGDCQFTVYKEQDELLAPIPIGFNETTGMEVLKIGIQELGATARQVAPYAAGAYAINKVTKALTSTSTHNGDVIQGDKTNRDKISDSNLGGDNSLVGTDGDGLMSGTDLGNVDSTHDPVVVTNETVQVVQTDKVQVVEVDKIQVVETDKIQVVKPEVVKPEVIQIPTQVINPTVLEPTIIPSGL